MEQKTKVIAAEGLQEIQISREFDLPLDLLFKAYIDPDIVEQWMGTKVVKLESKKHGSFQYETTDPKGNKHGFNGTIHEIISNRKITRTFEMENSPFGVQLEVFNFESLAENTSKLQKHVIFESVAQRDQMLKLPFIQGINRAHDRLENLVSKLINKPSL